MCVCVEIFFLRSKNMQKKPEMSHVAEYPEKNVQRSTKKNEVEVK